MLIYFDISKIMIKMKADKSKTIVFLLCILVELNTRNNCFIFSKQLFFDFEFSKILKKEFENREKCDADRFT